MDTRWMRIGCAAVAGLLFNLAFRLTPVWWAAWLAPIPILLAAFGASAREARWLTWSAAAIGASSNATYYLTTTGPIATVVILTLQVLAWGFFVLRTRAVVRTSRHWTVSLLFPVLLAGVDTLVSFFSPHGTWGSYAYSQMDALWVVQIASVAGTAGVAFTVGLFASTIAIALHRGRRVERPLLAYGLPVVLLLGSVGFGAVRLIQAGPTPAVRVGIASIDDFIAEGATTGRADAIWRRYEDTAANLAHRGARIVVLPEKIEALTPADAATRKQALAGLAQTTGTYLVVGVQINETDRKENVSWLMSPRGELLAQYRKQHMVPYLENDLTPGHEYIARTLVDSSYGLAICKDMTFADFGRAYGNMGVAAMLVPGWDFFYRDAWMASEIAAMRGVENGYSVVRAGRESYLQASDRYGRVVARRPSAAWPGSSLVADVPLGPASPTLYSRIGDAFGWICVAIAVFTLWSSSSSRRRASLP